MNLDLRSPLFYKKINFLPFFLKIEQIPCPGIENSPCQPDEEILLCCELNPAQSRSIEPQTEHFLERLVFIGQTAKDAQQGETVSLPAGHYLFAQRRCEAHLGQDEWLDMAIEQQKDGLWERNKLKALLYVRFLQEDGAFVTQVFREVEGK